MKKCPKTNPEQFPAIMTQQHPFCAKRKPNLKGQLVRDVINLRPNWFHKGRSNRKAINFNLGSQQTSFHCSLCYICCWAVASCYKFMKPTKEDIDYQNYTVKNRSKHKP